MISTGACITSHGTYRYALWRIWDEFLPTVAFIGLNPSTADETEDDPTIRRCVNYAKTWSYGGIYMLNLFAFRATEPKVMKAATDPVGPSNDTNILKYAKKCDKVIAAWGTNGTLNNRNIDVETGLGSHGIKLWCLKKTAGGHPNHPLYLKKDLKPIPF